jgi:hypothetical protein
MTPIEKAIRDFCGHHADWWPSTTQVQEMLALAKLEQEPVAWMTTAPQRPWVGLTDDEIKEIVGPWGDTPIKGYTRELIDKIEAKLRSKN